MKTLFVTAFLSIYETENATALRGASERIASFIKLARTGIPIRIFVCPVHESAVREAIELYPNVQIHRVLSLSETRTYATLAPYRDKLPDTRSVVKDTFEYMTLMNAKMEFISEIMDTYDYEQYAWVDFNIWYIFRNDLVSSFTLAMLAESELISDEAIYMPGCWNWTKGMMTDRAWARVLWRFCGGFFIGKAEAMRKACRAIEDNLGGLCADAGAITWEVNIWHLMESRELWAPIWYSADHNDSMIAIPGEHIRMPVPFATALNGRFPVGCLFESPGTLNGVYNLLPRMQGFCPSSVAFCRRKSGERVANVRYVNYELTPQGAYIIHHPQGHLYTKNIACILDETYAIQGISMMADKPVGLVSRHGAIEGLEDIRLFEVDGALQFIATQREFSQENVNRMAVGTYSVERMALDDVRVIEPPQYTGCEKNWVPIVHRVEGREAQVQYIYSWGPIRAGIIDNETKKLTITDSVSSHRDGILGKMKGSSTFVDCSDGTLLGVIHYSEEGSPRRYFHCLVRLDAETLKPVALSHPFVFQKVGIEFCIGFDIEDGGERYRFWYSQHDKSPAWCSVPVGNFHFYTC